MCLDVGLTNCFKYTSEPKQPEKRILNGRVIEYGSGLPIAGASFSYSFCTRVASTGCAETESQTIVTDADGSLTVPAQSISSLLLFSSDYFAFRKEGYWENAIGGFVQYGSDFPYPIYFLNNAGGADSFHVELFPIVTIRIHAKNISPATPETSFYLGCQAQYLQNYAPREGYGPDLRQGMDTTFEQAVFGNVENRFYVNRIIGNTTDTVFTYSQFIAKGDILNLEVLY
jgi:hypothetical protein